VGCAPGEDDPAASDVAADAVASELAASAAVVDCEDDFLLLLSLSLSLSFSPPLPLLDRSLSDLERDFLDEDDFFGGLEMAVP